MRIIKIVLLCSILIAVLAVSAAYLLLASSLPQLSGSLSVSGINQQVSIQRDALGTASIYADSQNDAAFALGFAHAQDRYFQMDLLRRSAAGELSELVGEVALEVDKKARFHQFRKRAQAIHSQLPKHQKDLLAAYTKGVNSGLDAQTTPSFEYLLTQSQPAPWLNYESLLVTFSMYLDLQGGQVERDLVYSLIERQFGPQMIDFFHLASPFQAALDGSIVPYENIETPSLPTSGLANLSAYTVVDSAIDIPEPADIGSNNWAVTGALTDSQSGMLSNDMHLSLRVPHIWYKAQLNYQVDGKAIQVTGVTLPGTPAVIVGSNQHIAWGFTNANFDNVDWVALSDDTALTLQTEIIKSPEGEYEYQFEMSKYGPVRELDGKKYALAWVAHQDYAVDLEIADMAHQQSVEGALQIASTVGIPLQNLMVVDKQGNAAWKATGAITARPQPSLYAIDESQYSPLWSQDESEIPFVLNPDEQRLWTANARVISTKQLQRFGDGGYALGARGLQIRDRLYDQDSFNEQDFYAIQLDNEARFLMSWHSLLFTTLSAQSDDFAVDLQALEDWQSCACADSVGYTLVRRFRSEVINVLMQPISAAVTAHDLTLRHALRGIEPAIWHLLESQATDWLPKQYNDYQALLLASYATAKSKLIEKHQADPVTLQGLEWGEVNKLAIKHPFSRQLGMFGKYLNMPEVAAFGDSYMPAVQGTGFGASQRMFVRPGNENKGILTLPGGQSGHPLSEFYRAGFAEYARGLNTPLLPQNTEYELTLLAN